MLRVYHCGNSQSRPKSRRRPKIGGTQTLRKAAGTRCSVSECVVLSEVCFHRETSDYYHGLLCQGAAFMCAFVFVAMLGFSLHRSDSAYGQSLSQTLSDPFVSNGAILGGLFFGLVSFPFVYFTLRKPRLSTAASFVFGVVLAEIAVITPFRGSLGLFGSIPALAGALFVCRYSGWRIFEPTV